MLLVVQLSLMLEFLKGPFLVLSFSCYTLMTFLMMIYVILLSIVMILLSTRNVINHLICGKNYNWLLNWTASKVMLHFFICIFHHFLQKNKFLWLFYAIGMKICKLVENDGLHNPSSLIFTFRLKFLVHTRKQ